MSKKLFTIPFIMPDEVPPDVTATAHGSNQGAIPMEPISFNDWLQSDWKADLIMNGTIDEDDYAAWWEMNHFSQEDWTRLNPDLPWGDYFD